MEQVIIMGSGVAGLTAAVYAARANLLPLIIEGMEGGGQLMLTTEVENFPGFPQGVQGPQLIDNMRKQAERFGARFIVDQVKQVIANPDETYTIQAQQEYKTKSLIIATGASARWLGIESEKQYKGRGVTTCATCDGAFYKGKQVIVVGGGDSACEEALFLTKFATKVTIVHRRDALRASKIMQERVFKHPQIEIAWNKVIDQIIGDGKEVTGVKLKDTKDESIHEMSVDGVFVAIGHIPNTKMVSDLIDLDDQGYIKSNRRMHTSAKGVFVCGDVQDTIYRQAITAAGTGCQAALEAERYLAGFE